MTHAASTVRVLALAALIACPIAACDEKAPSTPVTPETPSTQLGTAAKMGRDTKKAIEAQGDQAAAAAGAVAGEKGNLTVGSMAFNVPAKFEKLTTKPSPFAAVAEYKVGGPEGEAVLKFFSAGGAVEANIQRWKGQMGNPANQPQTKTAGDFRITTLAMDGTYTGMGPSGGAAPSIPGTRFLGAIIVNSAGEQVQVRLTGPRDVVEGIEAEWNAMVNGVQGK